MVNQNFKSDLTLKEAAEFLGVSERTAYMSWPKWTKDEIVKPWRYGGKGRLMFKRSELENLKTSWTISLEQQRLQ